MWEILGKIELLIALAVVLGMGGIMSWLGEHILVRLGLEPVWKNYVFLWLAFAQIALVVGALVFWAGAKGYKSLYPSEVIGGRITDCAVFGFPKLDIGSQSFNVGVAVRVKMWSKISTAYPVSFKMDLDGESTVLKTVGSEFSQKIGLGDTYNIRDWSDHSNDNGVSEKPSDGSLVFFANFETQPKGDIVLSIETTRDSKLVIYHKC